MKALKVFVLCLAASLHLTEAVKAKATSGTQLNVNPIRRVVTMLQMMQKKVTAEGEKEAELYDAFMCYCKNGAASLSKAIADAETKIPQLESDLKAGGAEKAQMAQDIVQAKADKKTAKAAMDEAVAIRQKTAAEFASLSAEKKADISAMGKAITSIDNGMAGFLQTSAATTLRRLVVSADLSFEARDELTAFLSEGAQNSDDDSYSPSSGDISGILKQMKESMEKELSEAEADESASVKDHDALVAAKSKEIAALNSEVESKVARVGSIGVDLVTHAEDLADTQKSLAEDTKFLADMDKNCKSKTEEWEAIQKTRSEELIAIADTIKLLNDDDALELFKKTLPSASFLQLQVSNKEVLRQARRALAHQTARVHDYRLDLISMSLRGKKVSFDKVLGMIDDMVALLKKEQVSDDKKKAYCASEFDKAEDEKKSLARTESDLKKAMEDEKEAIAALAEEIVALEAGIKDLDKSVAEATDTRKKENKVYVDELAANNAAVEIIGIAKNRMNKFYNPKMYKAPPKREMSESEAITVNMGGTLAPTAAPGGIALVDESAAPSFAQLRMQAHAALKARLGEAPPPPPATVEAYNKKSAEGGGVIAMMDALMKDVKKEITEMEVEEKNAQAEYETFMKDSADKRAADAKSVAEKAAAKADTSAKLTKHAEELKATKGEIYANVEFTMGIHQECDWLLQNFDMRKSARAGEVDSLTKAKAVLSGADYSLLQVSHVHRRMLR